MSQKNPWSHQGLEALKKKEKAMKGLIMAQILGIIILILTGIIVTYKKGFGVFTIFFIFFVPILIKGTTSLSQIQKEIRTREADEAMF